MLIKEAVNAKLRSNFWVQESLIWKLDILTFLSSVSLPIVSPICLGATVPRKELGNLVYLRENPTH
jgi:hypothetical protein